MAMGILLLSQASTAGPAQVCILEAKVSFSVAPEWGFSCSMDIFPFCSIHQTTEIRWYTPLVPDKS